MKVDLNWGKEDKISLELPESWEVISIAMPKDKPGLAHVEDEIKEALNNPIGSPPLKNFINPDKKIALVIEDISRPSPTAQAVSLIVDEVIKNEGKYENLIILPGLGAHREMNEEEMAKKAGDEVIQKIRWKNPDIRDKSLQVYIGRTSRKTPLYVDREIAKADLIIFIGTIEPHVQAGFGGGYKGLLPGVAGIETIGKNHLLAATKKHFSAIGRNPEQIPMRLDMEEAGRMLGKDCFMINFILNHRLEVAKVVGGDPLEAHRQGIKAAREIYGVEIPEEADIVITNSYPMDLDFRQGVKCLANTLFAAKDGGTILALLRCEEGLGSMRIPEKIPSQKTIRRLLKLIGNKGLLFLGERIFSKIELEEKFAMYFALQAIKRNRIIIFAPTLTSDIIKEVPLFEHFLDVDEAIYQLKREKEYARVIIFPMGGVSYPV